MDNACFATKPIRGALTQWAPVRIDLVSHSEREPVWNQLVDRYHYLGFRQLPGHRLKYLASIEEQSIGLPANPERARAAARVLIEWREWIWADPCSSSEA